MSLKGWVVSGLVILAVGLLTTYGVIVYDAVVTAHYLHVFTLTPLIPYMLGAIFVYRQRCRVWPLRILVGLSLLLTVFGLSLFLVLYTPEGATVLKARVILLVPVAQSAVIGLFGAWCEWQYRSPRKPTTASEYPLY